MAGYFDEAARLANLVANGSMTQVDAEVTFYQYLVDNGIAITSVGASSIVQQPSGMGAPDEEDWDALVARSYRICSGCHEVIIGDALYHNRLRWYVHQDITCMQNVNGEDISTHAMTLVKDEQ